MTLTDDLELGTNRKVSSQGTHVKYEGPKSYQSKDMANVKVFCGQTNGRTDGQTDGPKPVCSRSIDAGGGGGGVAQK